MPFAARANPRLPETLPLQGAGIFLLCLLTSFPAAAADLNESYVPPADPVNDYLDAIEATRAEHSPYSADLADLYLGLGQSLLERGAHEEAKNAFLDGTQVLRVNYGLNSPQQTDYLFSIAEIEHDQGRWDSAVEALHQIKWINQQNYGESDMSMLPVLTRIYDWYAIRRPLNSPYARYADLERYDALASEIARVSERSKGLGHPDTAASYRRVGQIHYSTVKYVTGKGISIEPGIMMDTGSLPSGPNTRLVSVRDHYDAGREAFSKVAQSVALNEAHTPLELAEAISQLGDWYLVFNRVHSAHQAFEQAWGVLAEHEASMELANDFFSDPTPVRFMHKGADVTVSARDDSAGTVLAVSMDVTEAGRIQNVEILDPPETLGEVRLRNIQRSISAMLFRPRLIDGMAGKTEGHTWHYAMNDPVEKPESL